MQNLLEIARRNFGPPGARKFSWFLRTFYLNISTPSWCDSDDDLFATFQNQRLLMSNGIVVWAHIVQANRLLFEAGNDNCPASVVFSPNVSLKIDPNDLGKVAKALFKLKGTSPIESELKEFADNITDERTRTFGLKVPKSISPRVDLYEASTFVTRKHLPNRILTRPFFPLLIAPRAPYYNIPLPSRYWPPQFVDYWCQSES